MSEVKVQLREYTFQEVGYCAIQSYHLVNEEDNSKPHHSFVCTGFLFTSVQAFSLIHCYWRFNRPLDFQPYTINPIVHACSNKWSLMLSVLVFDCKPKYMQKRINNLQYSVCSNAIAAQTEASLNIKKRETHK